MVKYATQLKSDSHQRIVGFVKEDVVRASMHFLTSGLSYLLMLAAMSFNVGIFFAIVGGLSFGTLVFGRFREVAIMPAAACCRA